MWGRRKREREEKGVALVVLAIRRQGWCHSNSAFYLSTWD
jgi:hypothetical protein